MNQIDFERMPKLDLHVHIDGSLRPETIWEIAGGKAGLARLGEPWSRIRTVEELTDHMRVPSNSRSLTDFLATFNIFYPFLKGPDVLERVTYELCLDLAADGLLYAEPRFAPYLNITENQTGREKTSGTSLAPGGNTRAAQAQIIEAAARGWQRGQAETGLEGGLILCVMRGLQPAAEAEATLDAALDINNAFAEEFPDHEIPIRALDLAGDESRFPGHEYAPVFQAARRAGLGVTIHAAEGAGPESAREALDVFGARRLGHGIRCREDRELMDRLVREKIPLEICLTSNLQTGTVESLADHPFSEFLHHGVMVTLNTDDPSVSGIRLSGEWKLASARFGLKPEDCRAILLNAVAAAFTTDRAREKLTGQINKFFA